MLVTIEHNVLGLRLKIGGLHIHHGFTGTLLVLIGLGLVIHDRRDWREWFPASPPRVPGYDSCCPGRGYVGRSQSR
jgi:hypothetical protein